MDASVSTGASNSDCRLYVSRSMGNDDFDGRSWESAFATLSKAIFVAHDDMHKLHSCDV